MKPILAVVVTLVLSATALAADVTIEWQENVRANADYYPSAMLGNAKLTIAPVETAKPKDPRRFGLFVNQKQVGKAPLWPDRKYAFAIVHTDAKTLTYVNGYPDGEISDPELNGKASQFRDGIITDRALSDSEILDHFKKLIPPRVIVTVGHRGDNHGSPENTNISYVNAIANHTPIVEMDLRLTKDSVLVLLHDPTVDRTTGTKDKRAIIDMTLADAEKLDAGSWKDAKYKGEQIPKVETICQTCRGKAVMMLDLKCTGLGQSLAELKQKTNYASDDWILAPWEIDEGIALRKHLPDVPMILLHSKPPVDHPDDAFFDKMKSIGFTWFSLNWQTVTQEFIDAAHKHDMRIYLWTVNDPADVAGGVLAGVDGLITDNVPSTMKMVSELTGK
jgi:glycerophosphoryl diester phosphodiesterase